MVWIFEICVFVKLTNSLILIMLVNLIYLRLQFHLCSDFYCAFGNHKTHFLKIKGIMDSLWLVD